MNLKVQKQRNQRNKGTKKQYSKASREFALHVAEPGYVPCQEWSLITVGCGPQNKIEKRKKSKKKRRNKYPF